jgi:hypothetical protein
MYFFDQLCHTTVNEKSMSHKDYISSFVFVIKKSSKHLHMCAVKNENETIQIHNQHVTSH